MDSHRERGEPVRDASFDEFYAATSGRLVRQVYLLTGDRAEAEDVVAEAYERAWVRWSTVSEFAAPEAWVRTVAQRLAISRWRKARNAVVAWRRRTEPEDYEHAYADSTELVAALRRLPDKQRRAIVLHHLVDLSVEQVAAETGSSVSAVKAQLFRGRAALADLLQTSTVTETAKGTVR